MAELLTKKETISSGEKASGKVVSIEELRSMQPLEMMELAKKLKVENASILTLDNLRANILKKKSQQEEKCQVIGDGVLEVVKDGFGFLRQMPKYLAGPLDIYVSVSQLRKFSLRTGDTVKGIIKPPSGQQRYFSLQEVLEINLQPAHQAAKRINSENLSPIYATEHLIMEREGDKSASGIAARAIDLLTPLAKGLRCIIAAPPKAGKTQILQTVARSIAENHPEVTLMVLLVDERPEEVTDMTRSVKGEVIGSTFDEVASRHVQVSRIVMEKAKRLVDTGADVVLLLDSLTRLARAFNAVVPSSGKLLSGGMDANAMDWPKHFFGSGRKLENGGSLTVIATVLIETNSRMDELIFEEFKGRGNCEITLSRNLAERHIFPAIDISKSGTRREEFIKQNMDAARLAILRSTLASMNPAEAISRLVDRIMRSKNNKELIDMLNK